MDLSRRAVQQIVFESIAEISNDYIIVKEELRKIREVESVVIPIDMDHA